MSVRGVYRFSSLVKQNKKAKICFVIYIAGKRKLFFYINAVIVKQNFYNGPVTTTDAQDHRQDQVRARRSTSKIASCTYPAIQDCYFSL